MQAKHARARICVSAHIGSSVCGQDQPVMSPASALRHNVCACFGHMLSFISAACRVLQTTQAFAQGAGLCLVKFDKSLQRLQVASQVAQILSHE